MVSPHDTLRREVLRYLYSVHRREVPSDNGLLAGDRLGAGVRSRTQADLKSIAAAIDYLAGTGHIELHLAPVVNRGAVVPGMHRHLYRISVRGIDALEPASEFKANPSASAITIVNNTGFAVVGNNNSVSLSTGELSAALEELKLLVKQSNSVSLEQAREVVGDIETIEAQVKKSKPSGEIISTAWNAVEKVVTGTEFASIVAKTAEFISKLI
jgi:hypothetical protein